MATFTIKCTRCGETWNPDTPGFRDVLNIDDSVYEILSGFAGIDVDGCIACEHVTK